MSNSHLKFYIAKTEKRATSKFSWKNSSPNQTFSIFDLGGGVWGTIYSIVQDRNLGVILIASPLLNSACSR